MVTKKEIYRLRDILHELKYIKTADTDKTATADRFEKIYNEGVRICNDSVEKMQPLKMTKGDGS